jgi:hypothetical protein
MQAGEPLSDYRGSTFTTRCGSVSATSWQLTHPALATSPIFYRAQFLTPTHFSSPYGRRAAPLAQVLRSATRGQTRPCLFWPGAAGSMTKTSGCFPTAQSWRTGTVGPAGPYSLEASFFYMATLLPGPSMKFTTRRLQHWPSASGLPFDTRWPQPLTTLGPASTTRQLSRQSAVDPGAYLSTSSTMQSNS